MNRIFPSMMCVMPDMTRQYCRIFEETGIAGLHIDIMDGSFVPNFALGIDYCRALREMTNLKLDLHLMIDRPEDKISWFPIKPGDIVSIHVESTNHFDRAAERVRDAGGIPFAALNPATPTALVEELLPAVDGLLVMCVNPGFAGQKLIGYTIEKISRLRGLADSIGRDLRIETDGNVSETNLKLMKAAGADCFVVGSSGFLKRGVPQAELRAGIDRFLNA